MPSRGRTPDLSTQLATRLLAEARADPARKWAADALCAGTDPELFFPAGDKPGMEARCVCASCPVRENCLAYAIIAEEPFGIWGGLDTNERQGIRRELKRRGKLPPPVTGSAA